MTPAGNKDREAEAESVGDGEKYRTSRDGNTVRDTVTVLDEVGVTLLLGVILGVTVRVKDGELLPDPVGLAVALSVAVTVADAVLVLL